MLLHIVLATVEWYRTMDSVPAAAHLQYCMHRQHLAIQQSCPFLLSHTCTSCACMTPLVPEVCCPLAACSSMATWQPCRPPLPHTEGWTCRCCRHCPWLKWDFCKGTLKAVSQSCIGSWVGSYQARFARRVQEVKGKVLANRPQLTLQGCSW